MMSWQRNQMSRKKTKRLNSRMPKTAPVHSILTKISTSANLPLLHFPKVRSHLHGFAPLAMAILKTDSPLARLIARSILHFLHSVEPASGIDQEGLEVAKECLSEAFKIDLSSMGAVLASESLIDIFSSRQQMGSSENQGDFPHEGLSGHHPCPTSAGNAADVNHLETSRSQVDGWTSDDHILGTSKDELFGQYFGALEKIHYFSMPDGNDDQGRLDRATHIFYQALEEMQRSGCEIFDQRNLAETLKVQGNKAMQMKLYSDAIELYAFAIALCEDNAVYYCNRAAAYTQIEKYQEAIKDCMKSIELDPFYSKAYSRLGFAYYAQGNYRDAIDKGFSRALQLDPNNNTVKENIRVAEQKLREEHQRTWQNQGSTSTSQQSTAGPRSHSVPLQFTSIPFNAAGLPDDIAGMLRNMASNVSPGQNFQSGQEGTTVDIASMFRNMASNVSQGQHFQSGQEGTTAQGQNFQSGQGETTPNVSNDPEIRIGGNVNLDFVDEMSEDISGALRSIREMFSDEAPRGNPENNGRERRAPG